MQGKKISFTMLFLTSGMQLLDAFSDPYFGCVHYVT